MPFNASIPASERDPELAEKLKQEWPGILAWALDGCIEWQAEGLRPPERVLNETADYLQAEDAIGQWLSERCRGGIHHSATAAALFASWREWADQNGEPPGSHRHLSRTLQDRGFERFRDYKGRRSFNGLATN